MTTPETEMELRADLAELLKLLGMQAPIEAFELSWRVSAHLDRPIHLAGQPILTAHASGAAFRTSDRYVILYQTAAPPGHQAHVVFHELMHVLRGHLDGDGQALSCRVVGGAVGAADNNDASRARAEWEAEAGATILTEWSRGDRRRRAQAGDDPAVLRFAAALKGAAWT